MRKFSYGLATLSLIAAGCVTSPRPLPPDVARSLTPPAPTPKRADTDFDETRPIAQQIKSKTSEFDSSIVHVGPDIRARGPLDGDRLLVSAQVVQDKQTRAASWRLVLQAFYSHNWRFYESVSLTGGELLPARVIDRVTLGCYYGCNLAEALSATLPPEVVAKAKTAGLRMRWNAKTWGGFEATIPAEYFVALDNTVAQAPVAPQQASK